MDHDQDSNVNHNFKRKKKRSFMSQVKKRFKKSDPFCKDRVSSIEHEYFMRVFEMERAFEGTLEEKYLFANNALSQTEGHEVDYSYHQLISRVIEHLLPLASSEALERFFEAFGVNLRPICVHHFASHVLEALMIEAAQRSLNSSVTEEKEKHAVQCQLWLLKVSKFLLNNIEEFMWDTYANPCLRTAMFCLSGVPHLDKHFKASGFIDQHDVKLANSSDSKPKLEPELFSKPLEEFFTRISTWPNFKELSEDNLSSGYLQALLQALKPRNKKMYKQLCKQIMKECFFTNRDEEYLATSALCILELIIEQAKQNTHKQIYDCFLNPRLIQMSTAKVGPKTVQKFITKCSDPEMVAEIVSILVPEFPRILVSHNAGVLVAMSQACQRLSVSQTEFMQGLMKALNCGDSEEQATVVLSLSPLPHSFTPETTMQGSLILQSLLNFQKPIKLVKSLLSQEPKKLAELLLSRYGSFVADAFCKSSYISDKNKQKLIKRLIGYYPSLAQSAIGSRTFDELWNVADPKSQVQIATDLASGFSELMSSKHGQFVARKVCLSDFKTLGEQKWLVKVQRMHSKQKMFASIVGDVKK